MNTHPFRFSGSYVQEELWKVEGEVDANHAFVEGLKNVMATSGGTLSEETLRTVCISAQHLKYFYLVPDNDPGEKDAGNKFVEKDIRTIQDAGLTAFVVTLPDDCKDLDEYLNTHTIEDLQALKKSENCKEGSMWLYSRIIAKAKKEGGNENFTALPDVIKEKAKGEVIELILKEQQRDETKATEIMNAYGPDSGCFEMRKAIREYVHKREMEARQLQFDLSIKEQTDEISNLIAARDYETLKKKMEDAVSAIQSYRGESKYKDKIKPPTETEWYNGFANLPKSLKTSYQFTDEMRGDRTPVRLTIPSGALTFVAAPTNHGKSAILRNLAIDLAERQSENKVCLYITCEECVEDVEAQFVNTYANLILHQPSREYTQTETIKKFYKEPNGENYISRQAILDFQEKEKEYREKYAHSGRLRIVPSTGDAEEIMELLEYAVNELNINVICIDYVQLMSSSNNTREARHIELKRIVHDLMNFSKAHKKPIILASQLNREVINLFQMDNDKMSECSDIEKDANTIFCAWNSIKDCSSSITDKAEKEELEKMDAKYGYKLGKAGKIFVRMTKRRGNGVGMYSILDFNTQTGKIKYNCDDEVDTKAGNDVVQANIEHLTSENYDDSPFQDE